jgi:hypothetical protein
MAKAQITPFLAFIRQTETDFVMAFDFEHTFRQKREVSTVATCMRCGARMQPVTDLPLSFICILDTPNPWSFGYNWPGTRAIYRLSTTTARGAPKIYLPSNANS